ncbi:MAG: hypothetical protein LIP16_00595 [Clostridium sp.]|nr:hypothetical protein [Clostridium sp.]
MRNTLKKAGAILTAFLCAAALTACQTGGNTAAEQAAGTSGPVPETAKAEDTSGNAGSERDYEYSGIKIRLTDTASGEQAVVSMLEGEAARELLAWLPMTIPLEDYANREKFHALEEHLPEEHDIVNRFEAGDFSYGIPYHSLLVFYGEKGADVNGAIRLGTFDSGLEIFSDNTEDMEVLIEVLEENKTESNADDADGSRTETAQGASVGDMQIRLTGGTGDVIISLYDNVTTQDLVSQLPMALKFEYYNATERITYPPQALVTEGTEAGFEPRTGDLALYIPWGNIAVFCEDFRYSEQLIPIGRIESGQEVFDSLDRFFRSRRCAV